MDENLPEEFSDGTKYVVEARGPLVRRYVELTNGEKIPLGWRKAQTCTCVKARRLKLAGRDFRKVVAA